MAKILQPPTNHYLRRARYRCTCQAFIEFTPDDVRLGEYLFVECPACKDAIAANLLIWARCEAVGRVCRACGGDGCGACYGCGSEVVESWVTEGMLREPP